MTARTSAHKLPNAVDILLTTLNARYTHAAFGLRYLRANLPAPLLTRSEILEFDINQRPLDILEHLLSRNPKIIGLGVYIWNADQSLHLAAALKKLRPDVTLILGGPEISHETDQQPITRYADYVLTGEPDLAFGQLCEKLLNGTRPLTKVLPTDLPHFAPIESLNHRSIDSLKKTLPIASFNDSMTRSSDDSISKPLSLPYHLYTDEDLANRTVYVEASRGCPFSCEFCLSSLDVPVRNVPVDAFLAAMDDLLNRGLRRFKFVDRTFNLNLAISKPILEFFLQRYTPGLFLHFEMIPDRLPDALRSLIAQFPPGALQFEVGIQTFNEDVCQLISRRQDTKKVEDNFRFLKDHTGVHIHADLIAGLPGESLDSFAQGFDRLLALGPQEIQVGLLKRLRGTPIARHDKEWEMIYSPHPPYEILSTKRIDFPTTQRLRRFSRYWDLLANSGNFRETLPLLWSSTPAPERRIDPDTSLLNPEPRTPNSQSSPFHAFLTFSDHLYATTHQTHALSLTTLAELLYAYLAQHLRRDEKQTALTLWTDYQRAGRSDRPAYLLPHIRHLPIPRKVAALTPPAPRRQARHLQS